MTNARRTTALLTIVASMLFAAPALAHRGHVFGSSFGEAGSGAGQLSLQQFTRFNNQSGKVDVLGGSGLAVDEATHNLYVADTGNNRVDEFTSAGAFVLAWGWGVANGASELQVCTEATSCRAGLSGVNPGEFEDAAFVAVDNSPGGEGDVYVADYDGQGGETLGVPLVQKFTADGALIESWGDKGQVDNASVPAPNVLGDISGVAVGSSGELLVGTGEGILEFSRSSGAYIERLGTASTEWPNGFAIDGQANTYFQIFRLIHKLNSEGTEASEIFAINPGLVAATGLAVASSGELYVDEGDAIQVIASSCVSLCAPNTTFTSPQLTGGAGLTVDSQQEKVYIAETAGEKIESIVPEPPASPLVETGSESVSEVSATSATFEAVISPRSETGEESTSYRFQYTTDERFQREGFTGASTAPVPDGQLAPSFEADPVTAHPQDLEPGTVYHYRVVAENAISRKEGKASEGERNGAGEETARIFTTQTPSVFALPDDRAWELVSPPDKHGALIRRFDVGITFREDIMQAASDGGAITYVASASTEAQPAGNSNVTQVLSTRGAGSWNSHDISTSREVADGLGLREYAFFSSDLSLSVVEPFGEALPPLSSEASEHTPFLRTDYTNGDREDPCVNACYRPLVTGAPGHANVPEGVEFGENGCDGKGGCGPSFLGASPDSSHIVLTSPVAGLTEGAPGRSLYEWGEGQLQLVSVLPDGQPAPTSSAPSLGAFVNGSLDITASAISADGSRIVWTTAADASTRHLYLRDVGREETVELGGSGAMFQTASVDDSRVFFTQGGDLYLFEAPLNGALSGGHTTDLTPNGQVEELVLGVSQDGLSVYFVASAALTGTPSVDGEVAQAGRPNLYAYRGGVTKLIGVLSDEDGPDWDAGKQGILTTARVSPDGRWLAFMSERSLTGYDNRDQKSGTPDEEVFLYDASADGGGGTLVCASCNPTGSRPSGLSRPKLADHEDAWAPKGLAANLPAWLSPDYQTRYLSDSGRLFFDSADALVPSDTNGTEDVYEYEPPGVGDCSTANATFSSRSGGCVGLISSGTATEESAFIDASESGDDVFFLTSAQLSPHDTDITLDVYDARVDGGFTEPVPPPACEGDACQSPVAAPTDPTPGSLTYSGPGNPGPLLTTEKASVKKAVKCAKGKLLSRGKCVKRKETKNTGKAKKTKPSKGRRAKS